jgi:hypothetical protein
VIRALRLPATSSEARALGCDLDVSGAVDNQLGNILAVLSSQGLAIQQNVDSAISTGNLLELVDLRTNTTLLNSSDAIIDIIPGCSPAPVFDPSLVFGSMGQLFPDGPADRLSGNISNGLGTFGPGTVTLEVPLLGGNSPTLETFALVGARITEVRISIAGLMQGKICGALQQTDIDRLRSFAAVALGIPPDSPILSSILRPDIMIDGQSVLSMGIGFTAVSVSF